VSAAPREQLLRVQCFTVSADGFGAGEGQTLEQLQQRLVSA